MNPATHNGSRRGPRVGVRCDAGPDVGTGHVTRCLALAEELDRRGVEVVFFVDVAGVPWLANRLAATGHQTLAPPSTPDEMLTATAEHRVDGWVVDSYTLDPACADAVRGKGIAVLAIVDGDTRGQLADVYLDQNLGAKPSSTDGQWFAGLRFALLSDAVRDRRPTAPRYRHLTPRPSVLAFFGGTDAVGAAPVVTNLLTQTGVDCDIVVIAATPTRRRQLERVTPASGQTLAVIDPTSELPRLVTRSDLVISAAGTSTWEVLCLGAAAALLCVVDNQRAGYRRVVDSGLAAGLGHLDDLDPETTRTTIRGLLTDPDRLNGLRTAAWAAVDGDGRSHVADALLAAINERADRR